MTDLELKSIFLKDYLRIPDINMESLYEDWIKRDEKYFKIPAQDNVGTRCLR